MKTPGKFSACISRKRKNKGKKLSSKLEMELSSFTPSEITSTSLEVNTSEADAETTIPESDMPHIQCDNTVNTSLASESRFDESFANIQ